MDDMKICFAASSGGHWEEIMCLRELADEKEHQIFYVTEQGGQAQDCALEPLYVFPQINRHERHFLIHFFRLFIRAWKLLRREKPDVLITTGALLAYPFCVLGKLRGTKIIYIESLARVSSASLTGRLVYPFADMFLVQWESLLKVYPKARYIGGIF